MSTIATVNRKQAESQMALQMLTTADTLRHCRWQTAFLVQADELCRIEDDNVETVLAHALAVADALESLATIIARIEEKQSAVLANG